MARDAYIRLGSRGPAWWGATEDHGSLIFIDCPPGRDLALLRSVPGNLFRQAESVLLRAGSPMDSPAAGSTDRPVDGWLTQLRGQIEALGIELHCGVLHQPVGAASWIEGPVPEAEAMADRARAIELEALLEWGEGIWKPTNYHYQLPSGEHASGFVRLADAIRRPRDAEVLASWLHADLRDRVGIAADTGTLSAVVQALVAALRSRGWRPGALNVLDGYPSTAFDVAEAVRDADRGAGLIGLLSVSSSGRVRDRMIAAFRDQGGSERRTLDVLVSKSRSDKHESLDGGVLIRNWHPRPGDAPLVEAVTALGPCELCARVATATLVPVNPRSFDGQLQASVTRITPAVSDAHANRELWELCNDDAIKLDAPPAAAMLPHRARDEMAIVIDHSRLITRPDFQLAARDALRRKAEDDRIRHRPADIVLVPDHELEYDGMYELVKSLLPLIGDAGEVLPFSSHGVWNDEQKAKVRDAGDVAVLTLGTVTGGTLQSALSAIQEARAPGEYQLTAWVVHARPLERRAWQTLCNSYAGRIIVGWQSYLPERSPLLEEQEALEGLGLSQVVDLSSDATTFLHRRREDFAQRQASGLGVFWGTLIDDVVTPNSIFGRNLGGVAVLTAVGSAMERARKEAPAGAVPARRVFEMSAVVRSYYDPMILAAVLRWLTPHEAWWGWGPEDEQTVIATLLERATFQQKAVLIPELLLAAAQGKLTTAGSRQTVVAAGALSTDGLSRDQRGALEVGLALVGDVDTVDAARERSAGASEWIASCNSAAELLDGIPALLRELEQGRLSTAVIARLEERAAEMIARPDGDGTDT